MQPVTTVAIAVALGSVPPWTWLPTHTQASRDPGGEQRHEQRPDREFEDGWS